MKVLVACEESQAVCKAFRERGHEAYSCDIIECSGGHPEWHIKGDVLPLLDRVDNGNNGWHDIYFRTMDGAEHSVELWDVIIAFPPCTYLTVTGNRWFNVDRYGEKAIKRQKDREDAIKFFMAFANDPLVTCGLDDAKKLFKEMVLNTKEYLTMYDLSKLD